ncbi:MAG TPA: PQQ-binding-like beta-propeller repeat protein [Amycolatopsis sp.]|uniref:PQQ-binding-like beta-propeller repeat protein n=1 Tax=Amycolatopsis sp. TaxID=37632 RepID=UPI002F42498D
MASVFRTGVTVLFSAVFLAACTTSPAPRAAPGTAAWAPWPSALHDARHSGASTSDGPTTGRVRWRRKLEGAVTPGPVVGADGTIYAASNGGVLHALDPADGRDRWTYDSGTTDGGDLSISPLLLPGGTVLFPAGAQLVALSPTGRKLWTAKLPGRATSPVTTTGDRVYVGDVTGAVTALEPTGRVVWQLKTGENSYGSVVTDGKGRLYTTADNALVAIDDKGSSSAIAWRADPHDDLVEVSAGLAPDGTALLGTNGHDEWAYRPDGSPRWHAPRVITYSSPAVTATGLAYVADHSGTVHVFDVGAGRETGTFGRVGAQIWSSTVVDRAYRLYFGGQNGHAYGFGADGTRLFDVDLGGPVDSYPALTADGALVIGSRDGFLTTIG